MYNFEKIISKLHNSINLTQDEACYVSQQMFKGELKENNIIEVLSLLNSKEIYPDELIGFARAMREISTKVEIDEKVIDCCGTGGDGSGTFNISTCAAFIAAACDIKVAKHGNKAITSKSGSADLLHDAGAKIDLNSHPSKRVYQASKFWFYVCPYASSSHEKCC